MLDHMASDKPEESKLVNLVAMPDDIRTMIQDKEAFMGAVTGCHEHNTSKIDDLESALANNETDRAKVSAPCSPLSSAALRVVMSGVRNEMLRHFLSLRVQFAKVAALAMPWILTGLSRNPFCIGTRRRHFDYQSSRH